METSEAVVAGSWRWRVATAAGLIGIVLAAIAAALAAHWSDATMAVVRLVEQADRMVVAAGIQPGSGVLYESSGRGDLEPLRQALRLKGGDDYPHCACIGSTTIRLYAGDDELATITDQHGRLVRVSGWKRDVPLEDHLAFVRWCEERGVTAPRAEYDKAHRQAAP